MFVFQSTFLSRLHEIIVVNPCSSGSVRSVLYRLCSWKFGPSVREKNLNIFLKQQLAKDRIQQLNAFEHGKRGFLGVIESKKKSGSEKLKGLDERIVWLIIIDHIHLDNKSDRIFKKRSFVVLICPANQIFFVSFFLIRRLFFRWFTRDLSAQIHHGNAVSLTEYIVFDVIVKGLFRNAQLQVIGDNVIRRVSLLEQRCNDGSHGSGLLYRQVDALSWIDEEGTIVKMSICRE